MSLWNVPRETLEDWKCYGGTLTENIIRLRKEGMSILDIAIEIDKSEKTVRRYLKRYAPSLSCISRGGGKRELDEKQVNTLINAYEFGNITTAAAAERFKIAPRTVRDYLHREGKGNLLGGRGFGRRTWQ